MEKEKKSTKEIVMQEIALDETEIMEEPLMPALGGLCGIGCGGAVCGLWC